MELIKASVSDQDKLLTYLNQQPSENIFIAGDILQYGFDKDFQEVYYDLENDQIQAVYLRYFNNVCVYSDKSGYLFESLPLLLNKWAPVEYVNVIGAHANQILSYLPNYINEEETIAVCDSDTCLESFNDVSKATKEDADELIDLTATCFNDNKDRTSQKKSLLLTMEHTPVFVVRKDNKIVSMGYAGAQSDKGGMIISVCTDPNFTRKGYASQVVSATVSYLLSNGKVACLFFDNPKAASIYHRLGFKDINTYCLLRPNK